MPLSLPTLALAEVRAVRPDAGAQLAGGWGVTTRPDPQAVDGASARTVLSVPLVEAQSAWYPQRPAEISKMSQLAQLLATYDGSVTALLSVLSGEQVRLCAISQSVDNYTLTQERVLNRHVELATARGPVLVEARTMIFLDRFPAAVVGSLFRRGGTHRDDIEGRTSRVLP